MMTLVLYYTQDYNMYITAFIFIIITAGIHASLQLNASLLTLLGTGALARRASHKKLLRFSSAFIAGTITSNTLFLAFATLIITTLFTTPVAPVLWFTLALFLVACGLSVLFFYFRRDKGTTLWIPRKFAKHISSHARSCESSIEAFSLGVISGVAELPFALALLFTAGTFITYLPTDLTISAVFVYTGVAALPIVAMLASVGGGKSFAIIQRWRTTHKRFLQSITGLSCILLGVYIIVEFLQ